ncbi:MAG: hypothetical protein KJ871_05710 [Alphaproteobacteria bacterium]|nr:hypothetical protein [Alphaproteobacteria bacterium]MBU2085814.1 hypothetical protein [Alphaproteobacteria bacterium]MBU2142312.1 hypothetical protein [Alphaproteobacteria bacterium]MBU2197266.1 hypothetical protein [Alphaproteobacteria bacterium]
MAWLLTHMWISLAGVGLFSLLFGWSMRGIMLVGKLRTARVDRDIARTELDQAKAEIEGLYAAQRNTVPGGSSPAGMADPSLRAELNVREKRLSELSAELSRSKAELQSLKSGAGRGTAPVAAKMASDQTEPSLLWRNRHLESRVQHLEAALHEQASAPAQAVSAPVVAAAVASESAMATAEVDKLKWQANFFKQRVDALEAELAIQPDPAPAAAAAPIESDDAGEELARLRWRNRFLEGRLAYFEGDSAVAEEASAETAELVDLAVETDEAPEDEDDVMSASDAILQELEEADAAADAEEEDAFLEEADEDEAADELEDDLAVEDDDDELEDAEVELENDDADEDDEDGLGEVEDFELEDDADVADEAESDEEAEDEDDAYDEESDDEAPDAEDEEALESDDADEDDDDVLEDEESDEDDSEDDESDEDDDADSEEDDLDEDDSEEDDDDESDDEEAVDEDDEEIDEDALDEADEDDDGEIDEESDDDADEDDSEDGEDDAEAYEDADADETPAERPIALPKAVAGSPDDLTIIGGIGPKIQEVLNELGIFHYDQIAAWSPANIAWVDDHLNFSGRIAREGWVEQAAILSGDVAEE